MSQSYSGHESGDFNKEELMLVHQLLDTARAYISEKDPDLYEEADLEDYRDRGIDPEMYTYRKPEHKAAVFELSSSLAEACRELDK